MAVRYSDFRYIFFCLFWKPIAHLIRNLKIRHGNSSIEAKQELASIKVDMSSISINVNTSSSSNKGGLNDSASSNKGDLNDSAHFKEQAFLWEMHCLNLFLVPDTKNVLRYINNKGNRTKQEIEQYMASIGTLGVFQGNIFPVLSGHLLIKTNEKQTFSIDEKGEHFLKHFCSSS